MAGLPWFKQQVDLRRDPRSLILGDILGDPRAWTYVVEMRMHFAENAPTGCVSGLHVDIAVERGAGWRGERGMLLSALLEAGFIRCAPARDDVGMEIEDLDWTRDQGAHVAKFQKDAKKPDGRSHKVVNPSREAGGSLDTPPPLPRGESRELRVEITASASQRTGDAVPDPEGIPEQPAVSAKNGPSRPVIARSDTPEPQGSPPFRLEAQKPGKKPRGHRADTPAEALFKALQAMREERCAEVREPFVPELWPFAQQNQKLRAIVADNPEAQKRFEGGWHEYLADETNRHKETAWSLAYFLSAGVRAKYETRAAREEAA